MFWEPSAGHGAIARWIPEHAKRTAIEPSTALRSRLAMVFDGNIIGSNFEDLNVVNVRRHRYESAVRNGRKDGSGSSGQSRDASARDGGRIVAFCRPARRRINGWTSG